MSIRDFTAILRKRRTKFDEISEKSVQFASMCHHKQRKEKKKKIAVSTLKIYNIGVLNAPSLSQKLK